MSDVELWECDNCGERAINGVGASWVAGDTGRWHKCARLPKFVEMRDASRVTMHNTEVALAGLVLAVDLFVANEGRRVPYEMRDAYVAACDALGLPRPEAKP